MVIPDFVLNERYISPSNKVLFLIFFEFILMLKSNAVFGYIVIFRQLFLFFVFCTLLVMIPGNFPLSE